MLYAGTTSIISFKYSILKDIVIKLNQWSLSAGNIFFIKNRTSETLRNETVVNSENVKPVSVHVPKHLKPVSEDQFGHYLAGLIDGDGYFNSKQHLVIVFHSSDVSLAYYIKKRIGFGSVKKVKHKNVFLLVVAAKEGLEKVINLINGKIRTEIKFNQITNNIFNHAKYAGLKQKISLKLNTDKDLKNHWLVGFSDAEASFQIKVINRSNKVEVRLNFQLVARPSARSLQKKDTILLLIKDFLGGLVTYNKLKNEYIYSSGSYGSAKNVINFFDYYHLLSSKHINFLKWRKTYIGLQKGDLSVIKKYSKTLSPKPDDSIAKFKNIIFII